LERSNGETGRLYKKPKNAEAFDKHYASVHIGVTAEAGDLAHFTGGGAELYLFDTRNV
jgi:hypothetical protein